MVDVGNRLKHLRDTVGWTQKQVAVLVRERYGWPWSQANVQRLETGREPLLREVEAFAELFGITLDELVHGPFDIEYESPVGGFAESSDDQWHERFRTGEDTALAAEEAFHVQRLGEIRRRRDELRGWGAPEPMNDEGK